MRQKPIVKCEKTEQEYKYKRLNSLLIAIEQAHPGKQFRCKIPPYTYRFL